MERVEFLAHMSRTTQGDVWMESLFNEWEGPPELTPFEQGYAAAEGVVIDESLMQAAMREMLRP